VTNKDQNQKCFFPDYSVFAFGVEGFTPRTSIEKIEDFSQWLSAPFGKSS
jgi:hypothetical protein